jgi:hypothetical protein
MMHQTQRLVSLADDLPAIRKSNETLQLLFLLICAENIAKLADDFAEDGKSRAYVQNFFTWFLTTEEQNQICTGITKHGFQPSTLHEAVGALYDVRCDVVHEGKYWGFHFRGTQDPILNKEPDVIVSLTLSEFRRIVVQGCIAAVQTYPRSQSLQRRGGSPS